MLKIIKGLILIAAAVAVFYAISFFFPNTGLGPSNNWQGPSPEEVPVVSTVTYSLHEQDIPDVQAKSYMVVDLTAEQTVFARRADSPLLVASLTKLMTAWIVLNYGNLNDRYTIQPEDTKAFSPVLGLTVGDQVLVSDLLSAMLVGSANDAAISLSRYIERKQNRSFIDLMNQESKNLRMLDTRFSNPNGFDSETNYSSSNDLRILSGQLLAKKTFNSTWRATEYSFSGQLKTQYYTRATNILLQNYPDLHAIKTGFTAEAGGSMISLLKYGGKDYLLIVIGSPNREDDTVTIRQRILELR